MNMQSLVVATSLLLLGSFDIASAAAEGTQTSSECTTHVGTCKKNTTMKMAKGPAKSTKSAPVADSRSAAKASDAAMDAKKK